MSKLITFSVKTTFIIVAILMPIVVISALGASLAGLAVINPENHGKTIIFPIGDDAAYIVQVVFLYVIAPLSVLAVILGGLNFKFRNVLINSALLFMSLFFVCWILFCVWALDAQFVAPSNSSNNQTQDEDLHIRSINLN